MSNRQTGWQHVVRSGTTTAFAACGHASLARVTTISVANYNISPEIAPNSYDVNFGIAYDVKSGGNNYPEADLSPGLLGYGFSIAAPVR